MHTSGFYFTGQVNVTTQLNAKTSTSITGSVSGVSEGPLMSILNTLFSTIFGRRLGTSSDGTTLRANANLAGQIDNDPQTHDHFTSGTRDLTLRTPPVKIDYLSRVRRLIAGKNGTFLVKSGHAYAGPRYTFLNKNIQSIYSGAGFNFQTFNDIKIIGTRTGLDGQPAIFIATSTADGKNLKSNFAIPATIATNKNDFSNTITNFSQTTATFDDTTP